MDVVWFSEIKWDYLKTRKQQLIRRKPDEIRLLYLEPYVRGRVNRFDLRREDHIMCATVPFVKAIPRGPLRSLLDRRWARALVDQAARRRVAGHMRAAGLVPADTGVVVSNVYAINLASSVPGRFLLYDCNDAHSAFPGMPAWTEAYYRAACRRADHVIATSQALHDDVAAIRGGREGCEVIGNGVDYGRFARAREALGPSSPSDIPRIGYIGAIAPWVDFEVVDRLAVVHPDWEIVLVGPVMRGAEGDVKRLVSRPNVAVRKPVPHDDVPALLREFTLGVIPFRYDALTRGVNPNKMYEYLAMGLPVVTTRFSAEVQRFPEVVTAAPAAEEFARACERYVALVRDPARRSALQETAFRIAAENDWATIADAFWKRVKLLAAK
jgi:glycosyltransferase involved in cell wall biosynthesis